MLLSGACISISISLQMLLPQSLPRDVQWQEKGDVDVDIGANPSAEGGDDEGVESNAQKVVDLIDAFRLNVSLLAFPNLFT